MSAINTYQDYTPRELYDELMCIDVGNADELHNALIVVVGLLQRMQNRLDLLEANEKANKVFIGTGYPSHTGTMTISSKEGHDND